MKENYEIHIYLSMTEKSIRKLIETLEPHIEKAVGDDYNIAVENRTTGNYLEE